MPKRVIIGLLTNTEEEPVTANTMKILIISHRYLTRHLFSSLLKQNKKNFNSK